jgi:hypothetical protein
MSHVKISATDSAKYHEIAVDGSLDHWAYLMSVHAGPVKYWLHNRIGGHGWHIQAVRGYQLTIAASDPAVLTFVLLRG